MSDELHERLRSIDPLPPGESVDHITGHDAHELLEDIMDDDSDLGTRPGRGPLLMVGVASAAAALLLVAILSRGGTGEAPNDTVASAPLVLGTPDPMMMSSCMALEPALLRDVEVAFKGTADAVAGEVVHLSVDEWYQGGDAATVELTSPGYEGLSLEGIAFTEGTSYLVTATGGTVNACGWSGEATAELQAIFDEAFASS